MQARVQSAVGMVALSVSAYGLPKPASTEFFQFAPLLRVTEGVGFALPLQLPFGLDLSLNEADLFKVNGAEVGPLVRRFSLAEPLSFHPLRAGSAELTLSLFGVTIRRLSLQVLPSVSLVASGHSVGVSLRSRGVLVVGFATIENDAGAFSPGREAGLRLGDQITELNGHTTLDGAGIARLVDEHGRRISNSNHAARSGRGGPGGNPNRNRG